MLQYNILYCDRGLCRLGLYCGICIARWCLGLKLYCNTISVLQAAGDKIVSQYKIVLSQKG